MPRKLTDEELMQGFSPVIHGATADDGEDDTSAREDDAEPSGEGPEGGTDSETGPTPAQERTITLDGKTYRTPVDLAEAFTREINRRDGTRGAELQQLRDRLARLEGSVSATDKTDTAAKVPDLPDPDLQIENPAEYQRQMLEVTNRIADEKLAALTQRYETAEAEKDREAARRAAWAEHCQRFYSNPENKVLVGNEDIVDMVLEKNRAALDALDVESGFAELARLAKERLAQVTGVAPEIRGRRAPKPAHLEGSVRRDATASAGVPDKGPRSLTQALKDRRRAAKEAFVKGGMGRAQMAAQ